MSATGDAFMVESHCGTVCGNFTLVDVGNVRSADRRGLLMADPEYPSLDLVPDSSLDHLQAASIAYRIAIGPQAGRQALTLYSVPSVEEAPNNQLLARLAGFSLHAATVCAAHQRSRLERLCRYITRPPIATNRLSVDGRGRIVYRYRHAKEKPRPARCRSGS